MKLLPFVIIFALTAVVIPLWSQSEVRVYGDLMEGFSDGTRIVKGNLKAIQGEQELTADWGKYYEKTQIVEAYGQVVLEDPSYTLTSGMIMIYFSEDRGIARQNPVVVEKVAERETTGEVSVKLPVKERYMRMSGREITSFFNEDRIVVTDNVRVEEHWFEQFLRPGMPRIASVMTSDNLEMFLKENKSIARGNVVMDAEDITAYGEEAIYYHDEEKLIITGNARALQKIPGSDKKNQVVGEKIVYFVKDGRMVVLNARADVYPAGEESDSGSGKTGN
ncbi:MAG: LptA/OstA family protein [Candidatus Wallbacteria bacterium]|nr:LptA/OstA family protein [Candidatus Wallbacteria bacterium]